MMQQKTKAGLKVLFSSLFLLSSSAYSIFAPAEPEMTDAEACVKLHELIADHAENFKQFRGSLKNTGTIRNMHNMQIWNAERVFPMAKNCQVWQWSSGLTNYYCGWDESDQQDAKASFNQGAELVNQCLGKKWHSKFTRTTSGGESALFYQKGGKTVVSIRYFKESRTISDSWMSTLYVGDESNLKVKVQ